MRVEPVEHEPFVYLVESESKVVPEGRDWREFAHRVELVAAQIMVGGHIVMNGVCTCEDMNFTRHQQIANESISRCKHINRCIPIAYETLIVYWSRRNRALLEHAGKSYNESMRRHSHP